MELEHGLKQIDIAPLIDMVFLLLIFFMLTASFVLQPGIKVNLPKSVTADAVKNDFIEIIISAENVLYVNGKVTTLQELKMTLSQVAKRKQTILIKSDKRASLGRMVEIWDICREFRIENISIATNQE